MTIPTTPEETLAQWKCCATMEEHLEHLAHLERVREAGARGREETWRAIDGLVKQLRTSIEDDKRQAKRKHLRLIRGGKK